ncbi:MAG: chromate transporter, partial [Oscillospiraceae bacterium]
KFSDNRYVKAGLMGIRPVVVGLISSVVFTIALSNFFVGLDNITGNFFANNINYKEIMIFALVLIASQIKIKGKKLHPIVLIILSALLGILLFGVM